MSRAETLSVPALLLRGLLAGAGGALPAPALAALADLPTQTARRHLDHLARTGVAHCAEGRYAILQAVPVTEGGTDGGGRPEVVRGCSALEEDGRRSVVASGQQGAGIAPDPAGWSRAARWYLASLHQAAVVVGSASLPGRETIVADRSRPAAPLHRPAEAAAWYATSVSEVELVLAQSVAGGEDGQAWRLALLGANIAAVTRPVGDWERVLHAGLEAARRVKNAGAESMIFEYAGKALLQSGRVSDAREVQSAALDLRVAQGDLLGQVRSLNASGLVELRAGNLEVAEASFSAALGLATRIDEVEFAALARLNLGASLARREGGAQARVLLEQAATYFRETGRTNYLANTVHELARTYRQDGDHPRALRLASEAVDLAMLAELPIYLAGAVCELGRVHAATGSREAARAAFAEAKAIYAEAGDVLRAERIGEEINSLGGGREAVL